MIFIVGVAVGVSIAGLSGCCNNAASTSGLSGIEIPEATKAVEQTEYAEIAIDGQEYEQQVTVELVTETEMEMLAKLLWGEARGVESETEQAAVVWCVLNRVDSPEFPDTVYEVITQSGQFNGYSDDAPIKENLISIVEDVVDEWSMEKLNPEAESMRVLPAEYTFFTGDGTRNYFRDSYTGGNTWDWELESPYSS